TPLGPGGPSRSSRPSGGHAEKRARTHRKATPGHFIIYESLRIHETSELCCPDCDCWTIHLALMGWRGVFILDSQSRPTLGSKEERDERSLSQGAGVVAARPAPDGPGGGGRIQRRRVSRPGRAGRRAAGGILYVAPLGVRLRVLHPAAARVPPLALRVLG